MSDEIILDGTAGNSTPREQHPAGQYVGVCVDVVNLGDRVEAFDNKKPKLAPKVAFIFQTGQMDSEGRLFEVSKEMTLSGGEKATLRKVIGTWRGAPLTDEEIKQGLRLQEFVGKPAILSLVAKQSKKNTVYTNIDTITPLFPGLPVPTLPPYTRAAFWATRKEEYALEAEKFKRAVAQPPAIVTAPPAAAQDAALAQAIASEHAAQDALLPPVPF